MGQYRGYIGANYLLAVDVVGHIVPQLGLFRARHHGAFPRLRRPTRVDVSGRGHGPGGLAALEKIFDDFFLFFGQAHPAALRCLLGGQRWARVGECRWGGSQIWGEIRCLIRRKKEWYGRTF